MRCLINSLGEGYRILTIRKVEQLFTLYSWIKEIGKIINDLLEHLCWEWMVICSFQDICLHVIDSLVFVGIQSL